MSIYKNNKYTRWYINIIRRAQSRPIPQEYTEKHHIIPRCMGGLEMVVLTSKEHFICHVLLIRMTEGKNRRNMLYALRMMTVTRQDKRYTSRIFEYHRAECYVLRVGAIHSDTTKEKIRQSLLGKKHTKERVEKMRQTKLAAGLKMSEKQKRQISKKGLGRKHSEESKALMSKNRQGKGLRKNATSH